MNVLITGGSRGIGKAIADRFLQESSYVAVTPTRDELDLSTDYSVDKFIGENKVEFDIIINNAGINDINLIENISNSEIERMIQINLISPIKLLRGLVGPMKRKKYGRIVNIGSIWSKAAKEGRLMYSATKHAVHGVTSTLSVELARYNILVNTVCPGYTLTELTYKNNNSKDIANISETIPMKRMAEPFEIAELVYFLCSNKNTYLTGQEIFIDGGFTSI